MRSPITTHVLDITKGKPAEGISVSLYFKKNDESWEKRASKETNKDGRIEDLLNSNDKVEKGIYKLDFETLKYFSSQNVETFYPVISIVFEVNKNDKHYHIPLLLSPFGYSTYRGS